MPKTLEELKLRVLGPRAVVKIDAMLAPRPGDYWHEFFTPKLLVVGVRPHRVLVLDGVTRFTDGWSWDMESLKEISREEFVRRLTYGLAHPVPYCSVERAAQDGPGAFREEIEEALKRWAEAESSE